MIDPFLLKAALAGLLVALVAAPLGCLVVWRRMAYFGDATGHAALLGVALAMSFSMPPVVGVVVVASAMALAVAFTTRGGGFADDTILGVFSHAALAIGLVAAALLPDVRLNLINTLLGDILTVSTSEILLIALGGAGILAVLAIFWRGLLNATLSPELMVAEGGSLMRDKLVFTLSLALFVALAMKLVGVLLITAMLILPAAAAAPLARSPERMVAYAALIGCLSVVGGLWMSWEADTPAGPSIIVMAAVIFALTAMRRRP
ncbi:MAG: metal ABC transporter permease [Rhodobacteraceae bacterium]|nr:metal ABC transporter permease [Paracoccaceae bacterium]